MRLVQPAVVLYYISNIWTTGRFGTMSTSPTCHASTYCYCALSWNNLLGFRMVQEPSFLLKVVNILGFKSAKALLMP